MRQIEFKIRQDLILLKKSLEQGKSFGTLNYVQGKIDYIEGLLEELATTSNRDNIL